MLVITVSIAATAHTATAIGHADRRLTAAAGVIRWVAELACVVHALLTASTVIIPGAFDTGDATVSLDANRRIQSTATTIGQVTGQTVPRHTLAGIGVITIGIIAAGNTFIAIDTRNTIRRLGSTALIRP